MNDDAIRTLYPTLPPTTLYIFHSPLPSYEPISLPLHDFFYDLHLWRAVFIFYILCIVACFSLLVCHVIGRIYIWHIITIPHNWWLSICCFLVLGLRVKMGWDWLDGRFWARMGDWARAVFCQHLCNLGLGGTFARKTSCEYFDLIRLYMLRYVCALDILGGWRVLYLWTRWISLIAVWFGVCLHGAQGFPVTGKGTITGNSGKASEPRRVEDQSIWRDWFVLIGFDIR